MLPSHIVAFLSMSVAPLLGEQLVVCAGGLKHVSREFCGGRKPRREMTAPPSRVPRNAVLHRNGELKTIPIDELAVGDRLPTSARRRCDG